MTIRRFSPGTSARLLDATITEANLTGWTVTLRNAGGAVVRLAELFPASRFVGYDFSAEAVAAAAARARDRGLGNARFVACDAAGMTDAAAFDLVTAFDAVHDQADPASVLSHIHRALKDDGYYLMQDIKGSSHVERNSENPLATFLYTVSCMHCMTVSLAQGGKGLGAMWGKELACEMLGEAGFGNVNVMELPHDPINYYYVISK